MNILRKNDDVILLTGKDKGKRGKVLRVFVEKNKVLVEGLNMIKKHVKPDPNTNNPGGVVAKEAAIQMSNVALYNPATKKAGKVGIKVLEDGRRVRYFKSNNELVDV